MDSTEEHENTVNVIEKSNTEKGEKEKVSKIDAVKRQILKMNSVVRSLENSLVESQHHDKQLVLALRMDNMKSQRLATQLEEARKENKQILNALQQQCHDKDSSRSSSRSQLESCPTISMVHLQYKYEELMSSYEGLLKVLESRVKEVQNAYNENNSLRDEIENLSSKLSSYEIKLHNWREKYTNMKNKKNSKIRGLKNERDTLRLVHNHLTELLTKQCMDQDKFLLEQLHRTSDPLKSLLLTEVRKTNQLQHENSQLRSEVDYLKSQLDFLLTENKPKVNDDYSNYM